MATNNQFWADDDDDDDDGNSLPEPARKYLRKLEKKLQDLTRENDELKTERRRTKVSDLVKAKGYVPGVANVIPSDLADDEAVNKWLDENGTMFAKLPTEENKSEEDASASNPGVEPEVAAAMAAMQNAMSSANARTNTPENLMALIKNANSKEELDKLLAAATSSATPVR